MFKNIILIIFISFISACSVDPVYRNVSGYTWEQLTPEQKQLIVDKSFQEETKEE